MLDPLRDRYPLTDRLEIYITSYSVHLIVALLTLPSLVWHLSTAHRHSDYGMPDVWVKAFEKRQFTGGRGWLLGFLFAVVLVDCVHALLALDYYHACRYERGHEDTIVTSQEHTRRHIASTSARSQLSTSTPLSKRHPVPLPTQPPYTLHPLLSTSFRPPVRLALIVIYDLILSASLFGNTMTFFHLLKRNWNDCYTYPENFIDPKNTGMSELDRCHRICADMYVSGGFAVALCIILLGVHVWHLCFRMLEVSMFGMSRRDDEFREKMRSFDGSEEVEVILERNGRSEEARSSAVRYRDWSGEGRRKRTRSSARERSSGMRDRSPSAGSPKWSEVLLGCLVP